MNTLFDIREATEADVPAILTLVEQSVRVLQQGDYSPAQIDASIGSIFGIDRQLIADRTYFVATPSDDSATITACGGWSFRRTLYGSDAHTERDAELLNPATDYAKIRAIFVHPAWSRRGLGSLILTHCEQAATIAGFTRFEMGSTLTGLKLYPQRGYIEIARTQAPLPGGESLEVVQMRKDLTTEHS
jgi:N-acetylglutamate synthase-like GNAT family acetyltransferase